MIRPARREEAPAAPRAEAEGSTPRAAVPFFDLRPAHDSLKDEIVADLSNLIDTGVLVNGPQVETFEREFATYCDASHCVGVASGLDALRLGLIAAGIEPDDEVIVPANTFVATVEAVTQAGGRPVIVDVSEVDYNLDIAALDAALTPRSRFVLPVHLYGQMVDMVSLGQLAASRNLTIVEDACQAHGAARDGARAGATGLCGAFSFYPAKNLGALGDAGAVVTGDADLAAEVRALREHGQATKYVHRREGFTARLDTIHAVVLRRKLPLLDGWNAERRAAARFYDEALAGVGDLRLPQVPPGSEPVWHLYVIRTGDPVGLARFLADRGIATGRHYPEPVHLSEAYSWLGYGHNSFPVAETLAREVLSLPMFPGITERQLEDVAAVVSEWF